MSMHKLLLAREKNMSKLFHVSMRNTKENENTSVLDKVSKGKIVGGIREIQQFFSSWRGELWREGWRFVTRFTLSRIMEKKEGRKKAWWFPSWKKKMKKKKKQRIIKARSVPAMIFIALCSYSAGGGKKVNKALDIPLLIGTEVGFYLLKNNIPETYFGERKSGWGGVYKARTEEFDN